MPTTVEETEKIETVEDKKDELLLDSLEIKGYRCFEHLTIEKLSRVNLIVGKNNVGKTALLEALWIYANSGSNSSLFQILEDRNEIPPFQNGSIVQPESSRGLRNLFYNRPPLNYHPDFMDSPEIIIGENLNEIGNNLNPISNLVWLAIHPPDDPSSDEIPSIYRKNSPLRNKNHYFLKSKGLDNKKLVEFWDKIEKWVLEDSVIEALKIITPKLKDIRFSGYPNGAFERIPVVRLEDSTERVPLQSLGEGMNKLLGLASALVNCEYGLLLIDEIESGLHYSVLPDVWKLIFKTAKDLNVQVFATTHSKDCIEAFAQAAYDSPEEGMLIRLERQGEKIVAKTIEEDMLVDAVNYDVEVR